MRALTGLLILCVMAAVTLVSHADESNTEHDTIEAIQCPQGRTEAPQIFAAPAAEYPNLKYKAVESESRQESAGYYKLLFDLPTGNYFFRVVSNSCVAVMQTAILQDHRRVLSVPLYRRLSNSPDEGVARLFSFENALAGALPVTPSVGYLINAAGSTRYLDLQNGAYYIDRVRPGKYTIRLAFHGGFQSEIPLDLTNISKSQFVKRDIDLAEIRRHLGNISVSGTTLQSCEWCY